MAQEINFYEVDDNIVKSMAPLLLKILEEQKRALIFIKDIAKIHEFDAYLWSFGRNKFIPHVTIFDIDFDLLKQPIVISNDEANVNNANYLIFIDEPQKNFINSFERIFHFFENQSPCQNIRPHNFYKKNNGKWIKV